MLNETCTNHLQMFSSKTHKKGNQAGNGNLQHHSSKLAAAGLLLWAQRERTIDRLLQKRRANVGSATLSAYVGS